MRIAYVTTIKDESDIILDHLNYYRILGVKDFYIIENNSNDNTLELVEQFKNENPRINVYIEVDKELGYYQWQRINKLANLAYEHGCDYIMPVDADEFLFKESGGETIQEIFQPDTSIDCYYIPWWFFRCKVDNVKRPVFEITERQPDPSLDFKKVILRWKPGMEISQGNHQLHSPEKYTTQLLPDVYYAHYNLRGFEHTKRKTINLGKAWLEIKDILMHDKRINLYNEFIQKGDSVIWELVNEEKDKESEYCDKIKKVLE
jgi:glycosyltransferase involved in cell wall biosynthesis